ncbi:hypothetical protein J2S50_006283 [Streptomyces sp. DSM 40167]|nr:hypothetical protein [Streptomyces sp. DSM 40167]
MYGCTDRARRTTAAALALPAAAAGSLLATAAPAQAAPPGDKDVTAVMSSYTKYTYPGTYASNDFDNCTAQINDYRNRFNVQECELVGLADLDTGEDHVRRRIAAYLDDLLSLGVDGFRIDAAKHMAAGDLADIKSRLSNPNVYWKHEAIYGAGEAVSPSEYRGTGDVQEFRYARDLRRVFLGENLANLRNFGGHGRPPQHRPRPGRDRLVGRRRRPDRVRARLQGVRRPQPRGRPAHPHVPDLAAGR